MIPNLYIGNGWKSPNINFLMIVWGSRYVYTQNAYCISHGCTSCSHSSQHPTNQPEILEIEKLKVQKKTLEGQGLL